MNAFGMLLDAMDSKAVIAGAAAVDLFVAVMFLALVGHLVMVPVRETAFGKWAGRYAEARMDKPRAAYAARKSTKAGAS